MREIQGLHRSAEFFSDRLKFVCLGFRKDNGEFLAAVARRKIGGALEIAL